jgi:hypothetical protein
MRINLIIVRETRMTVSDDTLYQGSRASKVLGGASLVLLLIGLGVLLGGHWILTIVCVVISTVAAFLGYKLSGGRENPALYADLDLFGLVAYAVRSANGRIGFHSMRNQEEVAAALQAAGFSPNSIDIRNQVRELITKDRHAFDACRHLMVIQTVHGGQEHFWNGFGDPQPAQWFLQAEIIIDVHSTTDALITRLFDVLGNKSRGSKLPNKVPEDTARKLADPQH